MYDIEQDFDPVRLLQWKIVQVEETIKKTKSQPTNARHLWAVGEHKRLKAELVTAIKTQGDTDD